VSKTAAWSFTSRSAQWMVWRRLAQARARERPTQLLATVLAIALGVALGVAVYLVNRAALNEFGLATRRLVGEADIIVRGPVTGFSEALFAELARDRDVSAASPVLEEQLALAGHLAPLKLLALDPFRAAAMQPALIGPISADILALLDADAIILSSAAADQLQLRRGERLDVLVGSTSRSLRVIAILPQSAYAEPLALMDLAAAQWTLNQLGRINRIDLRLRTGTDMAAYRTGLAARLPPGVLALAPEVELDQAASATRAYRVNLNMLALVTLLTGAFLVFSTQWLSVLRRRSQLALLRALGVTRGELGSALLFEGGVIGALGSALGIVLGIGAAAAVLQYLNADLANGRMVLAPAAVGKSTLPLILFFALGTAVSALGAWRPAREAARRAPALALKAGDTEEGLRGFQSKIPALLLIGAALLLVALPPVHDLPVAGYAAVASLLLGSVLLAPPLMRFLLARVPRTGRVTVDTALAQLKGSVGLSAVSLAAIIVSFSLMVAMTIMVHSFRDSFELWLGKMLPADLQLRVPLGSDTAALSDADQGLLASLPGIARTEFRRAQPIYLRSDRPAVTLIARDGNTRTLIGNLPLIRQAPLPWPGDAYPIWISEALQDLYGLRSGDHLNLPIAGREQPVFVAGIWRDYVRPGGALVMERALYIRLTGDGGATEAALWLKPGVNAAAVTSAVQAHFGNDTALEIVSTNVVRSRSLLIFDRAFAMTYALEIIAVLIGLVGVGVATSSTALARRAQFGMLRHLGMLRAQVLGMLASDGLFMSGLGVLYGLTLGLGLSLVLIYVINRQSFNWSIDLSVPWGSLAILSGALIAAVTLTAIWSGRATLGESAIRAVREDW
jgi:putative ABC transport system permease protein